MKSIHLTIEEHNSLKYVLKDTKLLNDICDISIDEKSYNLNINSKLLKDFISIIVKECDDIPVEYFVGLISLKEKLKYYTESSL